MIQPPQTQVLDFYRAGMKTAADIAKASLENAEKLQNRQLQIVRNALEENARSASELSQAKSLDELMALQTRLASAQLERMIEFWGGFWRDFTAGTTESATRIAASQVQSMAERQGGERRPEQPQRKSANA